MSGTGKSTVLEALAARGYRTVELEGDWCVPLPAGRQRWDEAKVSALLDDDAGDVLVVAGCEDNMGAFLPRFDRVILLSAPVDVILGRLQTRTTNDFGKSPDERERIVTDIAEVEPLLRRIADAEIDTSATPEETLAQVLTAIDG